MAELNLPRMDVPTLLIAFATVSIAADAILLILFGAAQSLGLVLIAKYPAALALGVAVVGARRLAARAAEACAEDLRD